MPRDRIVLPERAHERIERHTAGLARHRERLRASGRHAALAAAEDGRESVAAVDLLTAVPVLREQSGRMTAALLGAERLAEEDLE